MKDRNMLMVILIGVSVVCLVAGMISMVQAADISIGGGVGLAPDYEGSEDYEAIPIPSARVVLDNGMYALLGYGLSEGLTLRVNLLPSQTWRLGPMVNYRPSRSHVENDQVDDLKNVSDATELGGLAGFWNNHWSAFIEFLTDTGDAHAGWLLTLKGGHNWILSDRWATSFGVNGTYASKDYMRTYFGINAADSGRSGLPRYNAEAGIKDVGVDLEVVWYLKQSWSMRGIAQYKRLVGDAADSPVVDEGSENQFFGGAFVVYSF